MKMIAAVLWIFVFAIGGIFFTTAASAEVLTVDTIWQHQVTVEDDIVVPPGITLTILPGTAIVIVPSESTKTDPEYLSSLTEITIRGELDARGTREKPITFSSQPGAESDRWAGIHVDGGKALLEYCSLSKAENALYVIAGTAHMTNCSLNGNQYGVISQGPATEVILSHSLISANEYGLTVLNGAKVVESTTEISGNSEYDRYSFIPRDVKIHREYYHDEGEITRVLQNEVLRGLTIWKGRIVIEGVVRLPVDSRLVVLPGTLVEFRKRDTNGDGIGENGLLLQGTFVAKGTKTEPILFRSAEKDKAAGDWDAVNIMNSDGAQSLVEYCLIQHAYRGLHFHFANVAINDCIIKDNYRGIQFQESRVEATGNLIYQNKSGMQARDSRIVFSNNQVVDNFFGAYFFRTHLLFTRNLLINNIKEGLRLREGYPSVRQNSFFGNRFGIRANSLSFGEISDNLVTDNSSAGMSLRQSSNVNLTRNYISANGITGLNLNDTSVNVINNQISRNGTRGIGLVHYYGSLQANNIVANGKYALEAEEGRDIDARSNWFDHDRPEEIFLDKDDEPRRADVVSLPPVVKPIPFQWHLPELYTDITWEGVIQLSEPASVLAGSVLTILPGTRIELAADEALLVQGRIEAIGNDAGRIVFTRMNAADSAPWREIRLEYANGSIFRNCDFDGADWALHSHFTQLRVAECSFRHNEGGIRFRSGPVIIERSTFAENSIGIRSYRGKADIRENEITANEKGVFVREKGSGLKIYRNNIYGNSDYSIRIGDFNTEDVDARNNYWGTDSPEQTFLDARREPGIGFVLYKPWAAEKIIMQSRQLDKNALPGPGFQLESDDHHLQAEPIKGSGR